MSVDNIQSNEKKIIKYELSLTEKEALEGANRMLTRNGKRLQVIIPSGVETGSTVKLSNALQATDNESGDILIQIKVKTAQEANYSAPDGVVEINDTTFTKEVLQSKLPVVVDFWAAWCGPCRMMSPVIEEAAKLYTGKFKFCKINVDENPASAAQYQAMSIPMLLFFSNGRLKDKSVGAISLAQLRSQLDSFSG
jgi:thioredoxin 1